MKRIVIVAAVVSMPALAWGPGDDAGGEPPGPQTFEMGSQPQCLTDADFWGQFAPSLLCGYVPPVKPPIEWKPPPIVVPTPPIPEPATWLMLAAGVWFVCGVWFLWGRRK